MSLYRKHLGLIFDDDFMTDTGKWTSSPSNACVLNEAAGLLRMHHSDVGTVALIDLPKTESNLAFQVSANYLPTAEGDEGGIVVWQDAVNKLEFVESLDTRTDEYLVWRAVKSGNYWKFYAKRNDAWEFFDSAPLNASMIGITLKGASQDKFVNLDVDRTILCKGLNVQVGNLKQGWRVELVSEYDEVIESRTAPQHFSGVDISLPSLPFFGKILVYDDTNTKLEETESMDLYGGDAFLYGTDMELLWDGVELSRFNETYLGSLYDNQILKKLVVRNPSEHTALDVRVTVEQYQSRFGYEWVDVALDTGDNPGEFGDVVSLGDIVSQGSAPFWVRFLKSGDRFTLKPAKFILDVSHS